MTFSYMRHASLAQRAGSVPLGSGLRYLGCLAALLAVPLNLIKKENHAYNVQTDIRVWWVGVSRWPATGAMTKVWTEGSISLVGPWEIRNVNRNRRTDRERKGYTWNNKSL